MIGVREYAWRRIRYEHLAWADTTVAMPGASEHAAVPRAARRGRPTATSCAASSRPRSRSGELAIAEAERLDSLTAGLAERALGNAYFFRLQQAEAIGLMEQMIDAAEATGAPGILAHAYYMCSVAQTTIGNPDRAPRVRRAVRRRRDREREPDRARPRPTTRAAIALAADDPARALALFDRSAQRGESVGNRWIRAFALTESLWIRAQQGDPLGALAGYRDVIDTWFRGSDSANLWLSLRYVAAILASLERDEPAAVLYGALEAAGAVAALPLEPSSADEFALVIKRVTRAARPHRARRRRRARPHARATTRSCATRCGSSTRCRRAPGRRGRR